VARPRSRRETGWSTLSFRNASSLSISSFSRNHVASGLTKANHPSACRLYFDTFSTRVFTSPVTPSPYLATDTVLQTFGPSLSVAPTRPMWFDALGCPATQILNASDWSPPWISSGANSVTVASPGTSRGYGHHVRGLGEADLVDAERFLEHPGRLSISHLGLLTLDGYQALIRFPGTLTT
jgi:hypothetical protein